MSVAVVIIIICGVVLLSSRKRAPSKSHKASKKIDSFSLPVDKNERRYMSKNVPLLLQGFGVFSASYLSRFASSYLASGHAPKFTEQELLSGVEPSRASWVLNHCLRLASARYNNARAVDEGRTAEASSVSVKLQRPCGTCSRVPAEKNYKLNSSVPVYPCVDCQENDFCIFWYKLNF